MVKLLEHTPHVTSNAEEMAYRAYIDAMCRVSHLKVAVEYGERELQDLRSDLAVARNMEQRALDTLRSIRGQK